MSIAIDEMKFWVAISSYSKIGPKRFELLFKHFKSGENIWKAEVNDLVIAGLDAKIAENFDQYRKLVNPEKILEDNLQENIQIITIIDEDYPPLLKEIDSAPFILYYKGDLKSVTSTLAIVGSRKISLYGKQATAEIVRGIVRNNINTISGLALGTDTIVHEETIKAGGKTVAVLGSGVNKINIYPQINYNLSNKIIETGGAIISEYPVNIPAFKYNFPLRNRIISGLSQGVLIIESAETGGSLITADYALKQNKKLFALPGNIYNNNSVGTNNLIRDKKANLITSSKDILLALDLKLKENINQPQINLSPDEKIVLDTLSNNPQHIDVIIKLSKIDAKKISSILLILEMKGLIKNLGHMKYVVNN